LSGLTVALMGALSQEPLAAAKPGPTASPNWSCTITFDETLTYTPPGAASVTIPAAVQSDGHGPYVDGADGVQCYVNRGVNAGNYGNMFVNTDRASARFLWMPGQSAVVPYTRPGYGSFENRQPGYFEITDIDTVGLASPGVQVTERRRVRIGTGQVLDFDGGLMRGDNDSSEPNVAGSASAWVTSLTFNGAGRACSWRLTFFPYAALEAGDVGPIASTRIVALEEGSSRHRTRTADFAMPFSAAVALKPGVNGCP